MTEMTDALAWALVHFLWQGAALAALAWVLMRLSSSASIRYGIGVTTMAAMVAAVLATSLLMTPASAPPAAPAASIERGPVESGPSTLSIDVAQATQPFVLPTTWIVTAWALGVLVLSVRVLGGWWVARRLARTAVRPISVELQALALMLARRLNIRRVVLVMESSRVAVPVMMGWIRPVVLLPPAALAGLSVHQVEAILAHEFAHIRRHDYLANLLQTVVETALFFHPAVWWISREVRRERELCCDDVAVGVCDRLTYATALSALAHLRPPALALAATDGSLRDRIRRIVSSSPSSESAKGGWMALLPLLLVVSLAVPSAYSQVTSRPVATPAEVKEITVDVQPAPTTPPEPVQVAVPPAKSDRLAVTVQRAQPERPVEVEPESPAGRPRTQQLGDLEFRRIELDRQRAIEDAELQFALLQADMRKNESEIIRLRRLAEQGLVTGEQLRDKEQEMVVTTARLRAAQRNHELTLEDLSLRAQAIVADREHLASTLRVQIDRLQFGADHPERVALERRLAEIEGRGQPLDPAAAISLGDQLRVLIEGEPDLPVSYEVRGDGTIRLPLLGSVKVQGLNAAQAQAAVEKLLASKNITNARVTVSATRR